MKQLILMADIIDSSTKNSLVLMRDFKSIVTSTNIKFAKAIKSPLTITLGDEFQGVIADLKTSLEIIIYIEEEIIHNNFNFKIRFVLQEGIIDTLINSKIAFEMLGSGLTEARERLFLLKKTSKRFYICVEDKNVSEILNSSFLIFQILTSQWRPEKDYEIVNKFIEYGDYKKVSELLNKNRSLIWKREKSLNIESYNAIKNVINNTSKI